MTERIELALPGLPVVSPAWLHRADSETAPTLLIVPALGVAARHYARLAEALRVRGLNALRIELRGNGESPLIARRGIDWGYLDLVEGELRSAHAAHRDRLPASPPIWLGHSLGGQLTLLHQARCPDQRAHGIALTASASPWYRGYGALGPGVRLFAAVARLMADRLGVFRGDWVRFGGPQGARLMREWSHFVHTGRLPDLSPYAWDPMPALSQLTTPIHAIAMRRDRYAPPPAIDNLAALTAGSYQCQTLDALPDGSAPGHFAWLRQPDPVADLLAGRWRAG